MESRKKEIPAVIPAKENTPEVIEAGDSDIPTEAEITKVIIVDFTAFDSRSEKVFFGKRMEEVKFELIQDCNTVVIHKTIEYDLSITNKVETKIDKPAEVQSVQEENIFHLLKARRYILRVAKKVINERISKKLIKRSDDLDDIIMNDNLH
jgi:hypothetical protein